MNRDRIKCDLLRLLDEVNDVIAPHESIRSDDDQYDDPELWWAYPVKKKILEAISEIEDEY
jgi:hypothetical protein